MYTDWLWFGEVGYRSIYMTILLTRIGLFFAFGAVWFIILYVSWTSALKAECETPEPASEPLIPLDDRLTIDLYADRLVVSGAVVVAGAAALIAGGRYSWFLKSLHPTSFNLNESVFHKDAAFYVFQLPWWSYVHQSLFAAVVLALVGTLLIHTYRETLQLSGKGFYISPAALSQSGVLVAGLLILRVIGYQFESWQLLLSPHDLFTGANYTDIHVKLPILRFLEGMGGLTALSVLWSTRRQRIQAAFTFYAVYVSVTLLSAIAPGSFQRLFVVANELQWERPYIADAIKFTRFAYDLDRVQAQHHPALTNLTSAALDRNRTTVRNIRIWDDSVLATYQQLQEIRPYYNFLDVDIDRYSIAGEQRQVMLAARELSYGKLGMASWINYHLKYTHGYGLCMSPVNESTPEGLPTLFVKNVPPEVAPGLSIRIERPEIYYGEWVGQQPYVPIISPLPAPPSQENPQAASEPGAPTIANAPMGSEPIADVSVPYAIVNTTTPEFDYPKGDTNVAAEYRGKGGVPVGGVFRQCAFAWRFSALQILVSSYITPRSRIIYHREVIDRARTIAPFLRYDEDPYMVVADGRLFWILDAYTTSQHFPYAQQTEGIGNYLRNSVKVVVDAYNGTTIFYRVDKFTGRPDPLVETYGKIFPGLFKGIELMPSYLRVHLRYPQGYFLVQSEVFARYHMADVDTFFADEDRWEVPLIATDVGNPSVKEPMKPFYVTMRPPGSNRSQFMLITPFTARGKANMRAWLMANCDTPGYGNLTVLDFPKKQNVFGPAQINALINQNEKISQVVSLWGRLGSRVLWGSLQVVPLEDSLLYVQPLYLQSETTKIPELKRVIVCHGTVVAMDERLDRALAEALHTTSTPAPVGSQEAAAVISQPSVLNSQGEVSALITQARTQYDRSVEARKSGDWPAYGRELEELNRTLQKLQSLSDTQK